MHACRAGSEASVDELLAKLRSLSTARALREDSTGGLLAPCRRVVEMADPACARKGSLTLD